MRACSVCSKAERWQLGAAIVAGAPNRRIATQYGLTEAAVRKHRASHLPLALLKPAEEAQVAESDALLEREGNGAAARL